MEYIEIGSWRLSIYSLMLLLGLAAGLVLATNEARRAGLNIGDILDAFLIIWPLAIIGARLYHVLSDLTYYSGHPWQVFAIWQGGWGIYGGVAGAILGFVIYSRWKYINIARWLDIGAPALLLGQAIGRWGNYFNRELFGPPTGLPWGIHISPDQRPPQYANSEQFHPLFLYESVWNIAGVVMLLLLARRTGDRLRDGDIALAYGIIYPLGRLMLERYRFDAWTIFGVATAQWVSLIVIAVCGVTLLHRHPVKLKGRGVTWLLWLMGLAALAVVAMTVVSLDALPLLIGITAAYILFGVLSLTRLPAVESPASGTSS